MSDPTLQRTFKGHKNAVTGISFNPSMKQLASSSLDDSLMIWNFKPQLRAFRYVGHQSSVLCIDYAPGLINHFSNAGTPNYLLASGSKDKTVRLWLPTV